MVRSQHFFKFQFFSKFVGWLYVPSEGHITTQKISPELGPKTVHFSHKIKIVPQTRQLKGLEVVVYHYVSWFVPKLFLNLNFSQKLSDGYMSRQKEI